MLPEGSQRSPSGLTTRNSSLKVKKASFYLQLALEPVANLCKLSTGWEQSQTKATCVAFSRLG